MRYHKMVFAALWTVCIWLAVTLKCVSDVLLLSFACLIEFDKQEGDGGEGVASDVESVDVVGRFIRECGFDATGFGGGTSIQEVGRSIDR